jgi:hypothetical protein
MAAVCGFFRASVWARRRPRVPGPPPAVSEPATLSRFFFAAYPFLGAVARRTGLNKRSSHAAQAWDRRSAWGRWRAGAAGFRTAVRASRPWAYCCRRARTP